MLWLVFALCGAGTSITPAPIHVYFRTRKLTARRYLLGKFLRQFVDTLSKLCNYLITLKIFMYSSNILGSPLGHEQ